MRARMALRYAGVRCELREVVLSNKPAELLAASPKGTVPVLVVRHGDRADEVIDESLDVMLWALAQRDPESWLDVNPTQANDLVAANDDDFKIWLDRYKYPGAQDGAAAVRDDARLQCERFLAVLESRLQIHSFLMGDALSFVDVAIFPFIRQCASVDREWFEEAGYERLPQWLSGFIEAELFTQAMRKYPPWEAGNEKVIF